MTFKKSHDNKKKCCVPEDGNLRAWPRIREKKCWFDLDITSQKNVYSSESEPHKQIKYTRDQSKLMTSFLMRSIKCTCCMEIHLLLSSFQKQWAACVFVLYFVKIKVFKINTCLECVKRKMWIFVDSNRIYFEALFLYMLPVGLNCMAAMLKLSSCDLWLNTL